MPEDRSTPCRIAQVGSRERQIVALAYAALDYSKKLLQPRSRSSFLGDQNHAPFPLPDETERAPEVALIATESVEPADLSSQLHLHEVVQIDASRPKRGDRAPAVVGSGSSALMARRY